MRDFEGGRVVNIEGTQCCVIILILRNGASAGENFNVSKLRVIDHTIR